MAEDRMMDLLVRWEELRSQGQVLTAEELCPEEPSLWDALRPRLARRLRLTPFLAAGAAPAPSAAPFPNVPGYEILEVVGRGGMGIVYKARQVKLGRLVALKMILPGTLPSDLRRFKAEAEAVASLQHPNIIQIHEVGEAPGPDGGGPRPYLVLEWAEGGSLAQQLDGTPLSPRAAAALLLPLAEAVGYAHSRGVVHRDLKPANVLLAQGGSRPAAANDQTVSGAPQPPTLKIADFGLAKRLDSFGGYTETGAVLGTPAYMPPEQAAGLKEIGPKADVYALGGILYELLTGRPPFTAATVLGILDQVRHHDPVPPGRLQPGVPHDLEVICLKCLEKTPADRYAGGGELAADLQAFLADEPIRARSAGALGRLVRAIRHHNLDERLPPLGRDYLLASPLPVLIHAVVYALWGRSPNFPAIVTAVTTATVIVTPLIALTARPAVMRLFPHWLRRRLWAVWLANVAASLLVLLLFWLVTPAAEPERLLLVYPVWLFLVGMGWFAFTDLLGIYHVNGVMSFAAAVPAALLPFWAPLITAVTATLNLVVIGLFLWAVHRAVARPASPAEKRV